MWPRLAGNDAAGVRWNGLDVLFLLALNLSLGFFIGIGSLLAVRYFFLRWLDQQAPGAAAILSVWLQAAFQDPGEIFPLAAYYFGAIVPGVLFVPAALFVVTRLSGSPLSALGLQKFPAPRTVLWICCALAAFEVPLVGVAFLWQTLLEHLGIPPVEQPQFEVYRRAILEVDIPVVAVLAVAAVIVAPVVEEVLFRGVLYGWLKKTLGAPAGSVISALLFSAVHFNMAAFLPIGVMGMALCWVYDRRGSLYDAMVFHAVFNLTMLAWNIRPVAS